MSLSKPTVVLREDPSLLFSVLPKELNVLIDNYLEEEGLEYYGPDGPFFQKMIKEFKQLSEMIIPEKEMRDCYFASTINSIKNEKNNTGL